jgi:HPt (histidine-containing phosphotransfer) domain-containing protein
MKPLKEENLVDVLTEIIHQKPLRQESREMIKREVFLSEAQIIGSQVMIEIGDRFTQNYRHILDGIAGNIEGKDWSALAKNAHKLGGAVSNLYAPTVVKAALALEQFAKAADEKGAKVQYARLEPLIRQVLVELEALKEVLAADKR